MVMQPVLFDMQRIETDSAIQRDSPSKRSKIIMRYIAGMPDVGACVKQQPVARSSLLELSKSLNKAEVWTHNDLRLIFSLSDRSAKSLEHIINELESLLN
jgi:hypothetical protein